MKTGLDLVDLLYLVVNSRNSNLKLNQTDQL